MRSLFVFIFAFLATPVEAQGTSLQNSDNLVTLRDKKTGETREVDKAKWDRLAEARRAKYDVIDAGSCKKVLSPKKTFRYYQSQFNLVAGNRSITRPLSNSIETAGIDIESYSVKHFRDGFEFSRSWDEPQLVPSAICEYQMPECRRPIGAIAFRLKVRNGRVIDKVVESRDYGWCDFNKNCITTEQIERYTKCMRAPGIDQAWLLELENVDISRPLLDGEHTVWFQMGTDNFLKNNSVVEAEVE
jgi:hypothetical protein